MRRLQWERIRSRLAHAYANAPFYRWLYDRARVRPREIRSLEEFSEAELVHQGVRRPERRASADTSSPRLGSFRWLGAPRKAPCSEELTLPGPSE